MFHLGTPFHSPSLRLCQGSVMVPRMQGSVFPAESGPPHEFGRWAGKIRQLSGGQSV
ncbi:hypothetical protein GMO_12540 [Gluconobacter morbifer G707]|uniref:Uncharacterized protein n=1 Tax=Gluconobacter morbifer G707 TaxID=1088869 RepID=G6XI44_9PROT|nr:hypothetical protein GMO_12540 [Gluconobacter morbifer G707]